MTLVAAALLALLWGSGTALAEQPEQAEIRFSAASDEVAWVGQGIDLHLELWTEALSFSGQGWVLPEVPGALLMQNDSSALNMNERRGGASWQGVRYSFQLYAQRPGTLTVPSFTVRFETRNGYGSEPRAWSFETSPLQLAASLPPGADGDGLLLTTDDFSMTAAWSVQPPEDGVLELNVGDALRLTVEREANDVPGMVFTPLSVPEIPGLGIYADAPQVVDKNYRGTLTGTRRDVITFVCEKPGEYRLSGQRFRWWNPSSEELREEVVPALELVVVEHPAWNTAGHAGAGQTGEAFDPARTAVWLVLSLFLAGAAWKAHKPLSNWLSRLREEQRASEGWAFRQVRKACSGGTAGEVYAAVNLWLQRYRPGLTQMQLAETAQDEGLARQLLELQECVARGGKKAWGGKVLHRCLRDWRATGMRRKNQAQGLSPLNPGSVRTG
jgi:hypothetical protein